MLPEVPNESLDQMERRRRFLSEAFHAFHQPLTALHCGLELSLLKQRSEEEYRHRIEDALQHAGAVLELNKALRELAESTDPGENFGCIELSSLLSGLAEELTLIAEARQVHVKLTCPEDVSVGADPEKVTRHLGNIASVVLNQLEPGGTLHIKVETGEGVVLTVSGKGNQRDGTDGSIQEKISAIRVDAACSYIWALGGEFHKTRTGFRLSLNPLQ